MAREAALDAAKSLAPSEGRRPRHVAIIMDGNGRWAAQRRLPRAAGHKEGVEAARRAVRAAEEFGIEVLTLYGFSSENWKRPADEINDLFGLLRAFVRTDLANLEQRGIRIRIIGERDGLPADIVELIEEAEQRTAHNGVATLVIAFNYGGQDEIVRAARSLAEDVAAGRKAPGDITRAAIAERLQTAGLPDPDLVIRTSGEQRLSNFLIWQSAYAELVFLDSYWPDFDREQFQSAIATYERRDRRFGSVGAASA
ncbi:MAG: isoprenyl transferase [Alphaproteobacteria bacterium]|nr:isoprenyl transferase [Alphaproteobacteria bacterium]